MVSTCTPAHEIKLVRDVDQITSAQLRSTSRKPLPEQHLIDLGAPLQFGINRVQDALDELTLICWIIAVNGVHHPIGTSGAEDARTG